MILKRLLFAVCLALAAMSPAWAQVLKVSASAPPGVRPGKAFDLTVRLAIQAGYHVQANPAKEPYIPTTVTVTGPAGTKSGRPAYPTPVTAELAGEQIPVYEGAVEVRVPVTLPSSAKGAVQLKVTVGYQACNDKACLPPASATASVTVPLGGRPRQGTTARRAAPTTAASPQMTLTATLPTVLKPGTARDLVVKIALKEGWHIQSNEPAPDYIPTEVKVDGGGDFRVGRPAFPPSTTASVAGQEIPVFDGVVEVRVPVTPLRQVDDPRIEVEVRYQACNETACLPPASLRVRAAPAGTQTGAAGTAGPPQGVRREARIPGFSVSKLEQFVPPEQFLRFLESGQAGSDSALTGLLGRSLFLALPLIFLLGLALNLTPCVYPIIPITISYFGSQSESGTKPVVLALFYVLGMALMYSVLGVIAGITGGLFGSQLQNPWVLTGFALVMFALALSQFDRKNGMPIWEFQLPAALRNRARSRSGIAGAMLMGLMVGVVAAPCIGPAVVALLQWVGTQKNPLLGFAVFFTLALGLGLPYVALAILSGSVQRLPRSGEWMIGVKHIFGVIMIWMGFYYLQTVLDGWQPGLGKWVLVAVTALGGLYLLVLDKAGARAARFLVFKRLVGAGGIALAVWLAQPPPREAIQWQPYSDQALAQARAEGRKVLVDFTAAWCAQCKELEHKTFSDPRVGAAAREFVALRADMTDFSGHQAQEWKRQYGIYGLPTVARLIPDQTLAAR